MNIQLYYREAAITSLPVLSFLHVYKVIIYV